MRTLALLCLVAAGCTAPGAAPQPNVTRAEALPPIGEVYANPDHPDQSCMVSKRFTEQGYEYLFLSCWVTGSVPPA